MAQQDDVNESDFHWQQIQQHSTEISELKAGQARLEVGMTSLNREVQAGFSGLQSTILERTKEKPGVNWVQVAALVATITLGLTGVLGGGFGIITSNMQREGDQRFEVITDALVVITNRMSEDDVRERNDAYRDGIRDAKFLALSDVVKSNKGITEHLDSERHIDNRVTAEQHETAVRERAEMATQLLQLAPQ